MSLPLAPAPAGRRPAIGAVLWCALFAGLLWVVGAHDGLAGGRNTSVALLVLWGGASALILAGLRHHPHDRFGPANAVTALRAAGTVALAGLALEPDLTVDGRRAAAIASAVILALDGLDGALARATGLASRYGARFDMEVDAGLTLVLSLLAWQAGAAPAAILALALPHYLFRALGPALPWLGGRLPPSHRRKAVCVLQVAVPLGILAVPGLPAPTLVAITLVALALSFGRDLAHLHRVRR